MPFSCPADFGCLSSIHFGFVPTMPIGMQFCTLFVVTRPVILAPWPILYGGILCLDRRADRDGAKFDQSAAYVEGWLEAMKKD